MTISETSFKCVRVKQISGVILGFRNVKKLFDWFVVYAVKILFNYHFGSCGFRLMLLTWLLISFISLFFG